MSNETNHVSVCVCTYKRPEYLRRLLNELRVQETRGLFTYSIVVADNDQGRSAEPVVSDFAAASLIPTLYCIEPRQNIALVRNKAVENTRGNFVAFIDDDELPIKQWLLNLFEACKTYEADGALGPVKPHFDVEPPRWVVESKLHDRPSYPTGLIIDWRKGRTGNVLLKKEVFAAENEPFRPEFLTGEDQDFFRRMIAKGRRFVWCHEALAYEIVPPIRWKTTFMLRKALLRGAISRIHPTFGARDIAKSVIAAPAYAVALPFALIMGHARFMTLLVRLFDHLGKLLACLGIRPIKDAYVTE